MHLKSLSLRGFKSFAKPTLFRFEPGITCVVGPNGSGKSNVVDALSWVMGEQGARSLRGSNMSDVIFAGSAERAGLGRAHVELTIDNSDGTMPIEYAEVTIARTLFRGGGSEYAINGAPARLLDVQELLSDTGMGKQMHVVVGQGQLDAVLRASPEDRRAFIDEAAGVLKHRRRKERALRKLEGMDQNLLRVHDLTEEIKRQLKPLARQAKAAREASGIIEEIDWSRKRLAADDLVTARDRHATDAKLAARIRDCIAGAEQTTAESEAGLRELSSAVESVSVRLRSYTELAHQIDTVRERLHGLSSIAAERLAGVHSNQRVPSEADIAVAEARAAAAVEAADEAKQSLAAAETAAQAATQARRGGEQRERENRERLERAQAQLAALQRKAAEAQNALTGAEARVKEEERRLEVALQELEAAGSELSAAPVPEEAPAPMTSDVERHHRECTEKERALRTALSDLREQEREAATVLAHWRARRESFAVPEPSPGDGGAWNPSGTVDGVIEVAQGWERALGALLGSFDTAVVISREDSISAGVAGAAAKDESLRAVVVGGESADTAGTAMEAVTFPQEIAGGISELLDGAWLAEDLHQAQTLLQRPTVKKVVTREGMILTRHTVAGPPSQVKPALVTRAEWRLANVEVEKAEQILKLREAEVSKAANRLQVAEAATSEALRQLRNADARLAEAANKRGAALARRQAAQDRVARGEQLVRTAQARVKEARLAYERAVEVAGKTEAPDPDQYLDEIHQERARLEETIQSVREEEIAASLTLQQQRLASQAATRAAQSATDLVRDRRTERKSALEVQMAEGKRRKHLESLRRRAEEGARKAADLLAAALVLRGKAEEESSRLDSELREATEQATRLRSRHAELVEQRRQAEVVLAQSTMMLEEAERRASDLTDDAESLIATYGPHMPISDDDSSSVPYDRAAVIDRLETAERKLARLGVVNPLAVEEHKALQERLQFLDDQVEDLRSSKQDLLRIIRDVDEKIKETFHSAFAETAARFQEVFDAFFPGGKGRLGLTDPDDPLHTGVTIYARPAGKKVTQLSLLSGGERSLAALAYLIAIFKARPSPFYVMDEVEAALDDINLSRVLAVLEELRRNSQLILITHQKRTMEIADALYGVSMRSGTSTVVSHRLG